MANPIDQPLSFASGVASGVAASVIIAAPGTGKRNYLSDITVISDASCTLTITSNGVTIFGPVPLAAGMGYEKSWRRGLNATENMDMTIALSAGTGNISYTAVVA